MGGKKQTTTNDYQFYQTPSWQGLEDLKQWQPEADPTIAANFGQQKNDLERSFVAPTGSYQTPELREQQMRSGIQNIGQNQAIATRADQYNQNNMKLGQLGTVAGLSAPKFANSKSTTKESGGFLQSLLGSAAQVGGGFI